MDGNIIIYVLAVILGIIGIAAAMRKEKKIMGRGKGWIAGIFIIVAVFLFAMQLGYLANYGISPLAAGGIVTAPPTAAPPTGGAPIVNGKCVGIEDTTVTLAGKDAYNGSAAGTTHRYWLNNNPSLTVSDAGTFTASPGSTVTILWNDASVSGGAYFSDVSTETIPCAGTAVFTKPLSINGTLTMNIFNEENNLIDAVSENETLGAAEIVTLPMDLRGTFEKGIPHGAVLLLEINKSALDDVKIQTLGGSELPSAEILASYAITYGVDARLKAYSLPPILSNTKYTYQVLLDADDTIDPDPGTTSGDGSDVILKVYPKNYFINQDKGGVYDGPAAEDEDDVQTVAASDIFYLQID